MRKHTTQVRLTVAEGPVDAKDTAVAGRDDRPEVWMEIRLLNPASGEELVRLPMLSGGAYEGTIWIGGYELAVAMSPEKNGRQSITGARDTGAFIPKNKNTAGVNGLLKPQKAAVMPDTTAAHGRNGAHWPVEPEAKIEEQQLLAEPERLLLLDQWEQEMERYQLLAGEFVLFEGDRSPAPLRDSADAIQGFRDLETVDAKFLNSVYLKNQRALVNAARTSDFDGRKVYVQAFKNLTKAYLVTLLNLPPGQWKKLTRHTINETRRLFGDVSGEPFRHFFEHWFASLDLSPYLNERFLIAFREAVGIERTNPEPEEMS